MSVRIAFEGSFRDDQGRFVFSGGAGGELTRVQSLNMSLSFKAGLETSEVDALRIAVTRDASHGTPEDLLATRYQFGKGKRGEAWIFPAEIWFIDDNKTGGAAVVGKFMLRQTQVMRVQ